MNRTTARVTPSSRGALLFVLALYACLVFAYQGVVPVLEGPDEPSHIHYVGFISSEGRLPGYTEEAEVPGEGMHPPL